MKNILVVDDDALVRKSVHRILTHAGYKAMMAESAEDALNKIKKDRFDLIISDIRMPGKDGVEAIREIRKFFHDHAGPDLPIIFITGYAEMSATLNAEELGEVILKPFDLEHLLVTIREYL